MLRCCETIRAANCAATHVGQEATLCGWVDSYRDHGGVLFIDCAIVTAKPKSFSTQRAAPECRNWPADLRSEFVIQVDRQGRPAARRDHQP